MKVLSGAIRPDAGSMTLDGQPYAPRGPRDALARGVAMIYQELALAPALSVEANVMLGQERVRGGLDPAPRAPADRRPRRSSCSSIPTSGPRRSSATWASGRSNWSRSRGPWSRRPA